MYPDVMELFESVGVDMEVSDVSFSVSLDQGHGFEWGTRNGLSSLFAQKKNVFNPWFWKMIAEIIKFREDASLYIEELDNNPDIDRNDTLGNFVQSHGYSELFQKTFLIPICASIWSCPSAVMTLSAYLILSFLRNHDILEFFGHPKGVAPKWRSQSYVSRIKEELENRGCQVKTGFEICLVLNNDEGCAITCKDGLEEAYGGCIIATHAPDAVEILGKQATYDELRILGAFQYAYSDCVLHHDNTLMPKIGAAWGSWNFLGTTNDKACITYWLNNVQNISAPGDPFLLTLNPPRAPKDTLCKWSTSHSIPSVAASRASSEFNLIQGKRGLWFCGAYQGYGFPEDGVKAGILAANGLLRKHNTFPNPKCIIPSALETGARVLVARFLQQYIVTGCLILFEEGGKILAFEGTRKKSTLKVTLRVHKPQFYWKVATEADLGFADAYINGDFSFVDAHEGLFNFFQLIIANTEMNNHTSNLNKGWGGWTQVTRLLYTSAIGSAKNFFKHVSRKNTLSESRHNISRHYDRSNELFSLFLDETMTYSCAMFKNQGEDLKIAQLRKVHTLIEKARINKDHHILEIGCGWGSLAFEVVKKTGCKYTGITLSENQLQYVESKVIEAGLQDQIELLLCDYRQLPSNYKYDRIISCGMIEHVGHECMEEFFKCCESSLNQNGILVLQSISVADEKYDEWRLSYGFGRKYIFDGGCLPSLNRIISAMAVASRFSVVHLEEIGCHYSDTLRCWRHNFLQNQSEILALGFDEEFIRTWEYYFDYFAAGFKYCILGDYQIVMNRPGDVAAFGSAPYNPVPFSNTK
ncbi:Cyclopropane-fatty-acyl-phospholipid synthase [Perilla frutescens var. frutescens]|nr:Cyclopropane-fatty-acyl-phospholipid synthase [Perilla frutescens var. frutescens]